jgi:hypothetical protein
MDDMDIVDQIAHIAGRLADLAGRHRRAMDVEKLAEELQAQIAELSRVQGQLMAPKSAATPGMIGNSVGP